MRLVLNKLYVFNFHFKYYMNLRQKRIKLLRHGGSVVLCSSNTRNPSPLANCSHAKGTHPHIHTQTQWLKSRNANEDFERNNWMYESNSIWSMLNAWQHVSRVLIHFSVAYISLFVIVVYRIFYSESCARCVWRFTIITDTVVNIYI